MVSEKRFKVLFADDDEIVQMLGKTALEDSGFDLCTVEDGGQVVSQFHKFQPDIVVLDVNMPNKDGITICSEIRQTQPGKLIPILMITGLDDLNAINRCLEAGATDFESKPVNWLILGQKIRFLIQASGLYRNHARDFILEEDDQGILDDVLQDAESLMTIDERIIENIHVLEKESGKNILKDLIRNFLEEIPSFIKLIGKAQKKKDYELIQQYVIYIRTKCGSIGAIRMMHLCKEIDRLILNNVFDVLDEIIEELKTEYQNVESAMKQW